MHEDFPYKHYLLVLPYLWYPALLVFQTDRAFHIRCPKDRALLELDTAIF